MRHRIRGRRLGRTSSHRQALFQALCNALIRTMRTEEGDTRKPKVAGRITTTITKAKEVRAHVERLVTLAKRAAEHERKAAEFATKAERNSPEWKAWRTGDRWRQWAKAIAPAIALRRRAFAKMRDKLAVNILFEDIGPKFQDRQGGYTRIVRIATPRIGDACVTAILEFVGNERDRKKRGTSAPLVVEPKTT